MPEVEVPRTDWPDFFAALAAESAGASVRVLAAGAAEPAEAPRLEWSLHGCELDVELDTLELALARGESGQPSLRYFVSRPREIHDRESQMERTVRILDSAGVITLLRLRRRPPRRSAPVSSTDLYGRRNVALRGGRAAARREDGRVHRAGGVW